jgi:tRNA threonylcarbamoyladenosine biosynthesis protein TsaB
VILAIETSSKNCSVSFGHPGNCLFTKEMASTEYVHNEMLHVFIYEAMHEMQIQPKDLSAIAVGLGPGSYTGLRIGMAAAKGFAHPLKIPLMGIDAATILKNSVHSNLEKVIVIDARRMDAFVHMNNTWSFQTLTPDFRESLGVTSLHFIGDGADKMRGLIKNGDEISNVLPSSKHMFAALKEIPPFDMNFLNIEPLYLKEFEVHTTPKSKL